MSGQQCIRIPTELVKGYESYRSGLIPLSEKTTIAHAVKGER
jgi:hypothetical protein